MGGYLNLVSGNIVQQAGTLAFLGSGNTWTGQNTFTQPVIATSTFNVNAETGGEAQSNGLYVADLGSSQGSTGNPTYTAAICGQVSVNRSIALSVDGSGYLWGYRKHTTGGTYLFHSKVKHADDAGKLSGYTLSEPNSANTVVRRNGSGDIRCRLLRPEYTGTNSVINYILTQHAVGGPSTDNYARPSTPTQFRAAVIDPYYNPRTVWALKASHYTCDASKKAEHLYLDTGSGAINLALPAGPGKDDVVVLVQIANTWSTHPVVVKQNGQKIMGQSADMTLDSRVRRVELTFYDAGHGWIVTNT